MCVCKHYCKLRKFICVIKRLKILAKTKVKDWSKIHQKQFEKMEDIDDYLDRKTKRAVGLSKTVTQV